MNPPPPISVALVDDDESLCRSLGRYLRAAGMRTVSYFSAESFLADGDHPPFHCLLLDVELPGISGLELHRTLTSAGNRTPVIFLTAHDEASTEALAMAGGCHAYLQKTDSGVEVIAAICKAVATNSTPPQ